MNNKLRPAEWLRRIAARIKSVSVALSAWRIGYQAGLVVSENSVRLCLIRRRLYQNRIIDAAVFTLDPDNIGNWGNRIDAATTILIGYLRDRKLKDIPINIGLMGEDISFRKMYLPDMPAKELKAAIMWEGAKLFPFDLDKCSVDYRVVDRVIRNDIDHLGISIIAAKGDIIEDIYDKFNAAGLKVGQIGFLPAFLSELLPAASSDDESHNLILYLNDEQSMAVFVQNGLFEFYQQFVTRPQASPEDEMAVVNLDAIAAELTSFVDLYNGQSSGNFVRTILVCGKYSSDHNLLKFISENTGLPCQSMSETSFGPSNLSRSNERQVSEYLDTVMVGMAAPGDHPLAPSAIKKAAEKKLMLVRVGLVTVLALMIAGNMHVQLYQQELYRKLDLDSRKDMVRAFEESPGYHGYINLIGKLNRSKAYLSQAQDRRESHCHVILKELSLGLPDHINLTSVSLEEEEGKYILQLNGNVQLTGFSPEIILADYVEALWTSPLFDNVAVISHNKKREQDRFDLMFQLKMDARV